MLIFSAEIQIISTINVARFARFVKKSYRSTTTGSEVFWLRDRQEWANTRVFIGQFGGPLDKNVVFSLFAEGWDKLNPIWPPHQRGPCKVNFCTTDFRPIFPFVVISSPKKKFKLSFV